MKEDDGNPYGTIDGSWKGKEKAWNEGNEHGQLHPSPQTIKKIQTNFAEKVKEALREHYFPKKTAMSMIQVDELMEFVDQPLKQNEGGD